MIIFCTQIAQPCGWHWITVVFTLMLTPLPSGTPSPTPTEPPASCDINTGAPIIPSRGSETYTIPIHVDTRRSRFYQHQRSYNSDHYFCGRRVMDGRTILIFVSPNMRVDGVAIRMQDRNFDLKFEYDNGVFSPVWSDDKLEFCIANPPSESCYDDEDCYIWTGRMVPDTILPKAARRTGKCIC